MSQAYDECLDGQPVHRSAPSEMHELLCDRLHARTARALPVNSSLKRLSRRTPISFSPQTFMCPDLALVKAAENRAYLFAEILIAGDHSADTVIKKTLCQQYQLPRLWIIDPRYLNVEIYVTGNDGFRLEHILANRDRLTDPYLPGLDCSMEELFAGI